MFDLKGMSTIALSPNRARSPAAVNKVIWPMVVLGILAMIPRIGFLARPFESDSGLYVYMGKVVVEGRVLYHDFFETKPPGVALFTAGLFKVFGHHWAPYVLLQAGMTLAGAYLLAREMGRVIAAGAFAPVFLFSMVYLNLSPVAYRGFQLETVQCFFSILAAVYGLRLLSGSGAGVINGVLVGLFAGAAAMLKPTGMAVAGAMMMGLLLRGRAGWRGILATMGGLLVVPALVLLWVWRAGLMREMPPLFREIALYGSGTPIVAEDWLKPVLALVVAGLPFLAIRICRSGAEVVKQRSERPLVFFAIAWLILEVVGVVLQKRMYIYHFLPIAPPLAVLFGMVGMGRRPGAYIVALTPLLLLSFTHSLGDFASLRHGVRNLPESDYLLAHALPGESVVGDPIERILMETQLRCGARYAHLFYMFNHDEAPAEYGRRFLDDLELNRPEWVVFRTDRQSNHLIQCVTQSMLSESPRRKAAFLAAWAKIDAYIAEHYAPVTQAGEMTIYRRR